MNSPINYSSSVVRDERISELFKKRIELPLSKIFEASSTECGDIAKYPMESIVESLATLFGNKEHAEVTLLALFFLYTEVLSYGINMEYLFPITHVFMTLPFFTERIEELERTVKSLEYALDASK